MTDREKIIKIIAPYVAAYGDDEAIADALIAAGIGDVSEYKEKLKLHRVFVRKDGGDIKVLYGNNEVDEIVKERNEYKHRAEVAERALLVLCDKVMRDICVMVFPSTKTQVKNKQELYDYCMEQAEKELAEEKQISIDECLERLNEK